MQAEGRPRAATVPHLAVHRFGAIALSRHAKIPAPFRCIAARRHRKSADYFPNRARHGASPFPPRAFAAAYLEQLSSMSASIFAAVEMAPRDPILGLNEAAPTPGRKRSTSASACILRRQRQDPGLLAAVRTAGRPAVEASAMPRGYQPIEGPRPTTRRCRACSSARTRPAAKRPDHHRRRPSAAPALKVGADYLKRLSGATGLHQRPEAGRTTARAVQNPPAFRSKTTPTTTPPPAA